MNDEIKKFNSFKEFYPFYLSEHRSKISRRLHYMGSLAVLSLLAYSLISQHFYLLLWLPLLGYGPAWTGHFFFEKNRPATFQYPLYSFMGDWVMLKDGLFGRIK
ncbi:MAG: hypothetical protein ACJAWS_001767 [Oleiphilaceae bacterium]|jgi:hypothetical protein